jgi:hypothetical protein
MVEGQGDVKQILRHRRPLVSHPIQFSSPAVANLTYLRVWKPENQRLLTILFLPVNVFTWQQNECRQASADFSGRQQECCKISIPEKDKP